MLPGKATMPRPAELRESSRLYREEAKTEVDPYLRRSLARHAFALTQLAEKIEREKVGAP
jgi:hypothetical protein